jgi:hypothetical protein
MLESGLSTVKQTMKANSEASERWIRRMFENGEQFVECVRMANNEASERWMGEMKNWSKNYRTLGTERRAWKSR